MYILDARAISLLLERAASVISFQPRFLHIYLIGTHGKLPVMDANGAADCYVNFSLVCNKSSCPLKSTLSTSLSEVMRWTHLDQSVSSSIAHCTLQPEWNELLEMPIDGGTLDSDGKYRNNEIRDKVLLVEAWDADCGKWGIALNIFRFFARSLACTMICAYVMGYLDFIFYKRLTTEQWWWKTTILTLIFCVIVGLVMSHMMSVVWRAGKMNIFVICAIATLCM